MEIYKCTLCPRRCGAKRALGERGACGEADKIRISRIDLHPYEEPPISGTRGSGTVFFCGCSLGCVFCQNRDISRGHVGGREYSPEELAKEFFRLAEMGAHNINLVTAAHFLPEVAEALKLAKPYLHIPIVYNSSGYEYADSLRLLEGLVDVYMPDFKYMSPELSDRYSHAEDYSLIATEALREMYRQVGGVKYDSEGMLVRGVIVRHLVLPASRADSIAVLEHIASILPTKDILLSLMSQYTPDFAMDSPHKCLHRRLTRFEYDSVAMRAQELGFDGFFQKLSSANKSYTPDF